jgi:uncharacterized repeat protein (TIGR03843 family)
MPGIVKQTVLDLLKKGEITLQGEFVWGSNYTFFVQVEYGQENLKAVYKPTRGEQELWDFPKSSLARREVAAYLVSEALGWELVPPTIYRRKGPLGPGSVQQFIEHNAEYHYFNFSASDWQRLRSVVLFDVLINNADRKGGHILLDSGNHIWLIDHGICFHQEDKLRTVVWDFVGEPIQPELINDLVKFQQLFHPGSKLITTLQKYISPPEIAAMGVRASRLIESGYFPEPDPQRRPYPWPPV